MTKKHLFPLLLLVALWGQAQEQSPLRLKMISGLASYRNELITANAANFEQMRKLDILWKQDEEKKELVSNFLMNFIFHTQVYNYSPERIRKNLLELIEQNDTVFFLKPVLTEENIQLIVQQKDLIDLLSAEILKPDPPFQIDPETGLFEELEFYNIKDSMRIAEVGAGNGVFSLVLGLAYEGLHIYVNDYDAFLRSYASEKINFCRSKKPSNQYFFVRGKKKSARLEAEKLDRVIVRNSLHHFSHQAEMLASIRESLAPGGSLYIYDPVLRPDNKANCPLIMEAEALRQAITGNGFDIVEEKENTRSKWLMLHCKPRVSN